MDSFSGIKLGKQEFDKTPKIPIISAAVTTLPPKAFICYYYPFLLVNK